uniref:Immunoglobulin domain-containing protein n=1 Tax=Sander lucioperca TaxID=283035 RepID=A0A8C9WUW1_SANLU
MLFILLTDSCCDHSTKVQRYEESSVSFSCPYESEYQNSLKYICRGNQPSVCLQHALISSDNKQKGQFTLTDDMASRKFTVTITSLTQNNSGSYLCGVHGNTGLDVFSAFELEVKGKRSTSSYCSKLLFFSEYKSAQKHVSWECCSAAFQLLLFCSFFILIPSSVRFLALCNFCIHSAIKTIQILKCSALSANDGTSSTFFLLFILFKILSFL